LKLAEKIQTEELSMLRLMGIAILMATMLCAGQTPSQTPPPATQPPRPMPPTRDPKAPGYVTANELPDGSNAPANVDGNFIIGPTHTAAPEASVHEGAAQGTVIEFIMNSADSKIYPGIARDANTFGTPDPVDPARLLVSTSHPAPYTRRVTVYVPKQYSGAAESC
jgi:iron(III)-enterobactin esterase